MVSPLSSTQIMLSKALAKGLIVVASIAISPFGIIELAFHVPIKGDIALFFFVTALYVFANCGLGLFIAARRYAILLKGATGSFGGSLDR